MNIHNAHESMNSMHQTEYEGALNRLDQATQALRTRLDILMGGEGPPADTVPLTEKTRQMDRTARAVMARMP
ncbi:hypothetical protein DRQ53_08015 [bacterium]|nr:MAG: hypothetical protein DRQ53_08015 [bacterium]